MTWFDSSIPNIWISRPCCLGQILVRILFRKHTFDPPIRAGLVLCRILSDIVTFDFALSMAERTLFLESPSLVRRSMTRQPSQNLPNSPLSSCSSSAAAAGDPTVARIGPEAEGEWMNEWRSVVNRQERIPMNNTWPEIWWIYSGWLDKFWKFRIRSTVLSQRKHGAFTVLIPMNHTHKHTHTHQRPTLLEILIVCTNSRACWHKIPASRTWLWAGEGGEQEVVSPSRLSHPLIHRFHPSVRFRRIKVIATVSTEWTFFGRLCLKQPTLHCKQQEVRRKFGSTNDPTDLSRLLQRILLSRRNPFIPFYPIVWRPKLLSWVAFLWIRRRLEARWFPQLIMEISRESLFHHVICSPGI